MKRDPQIDYLRRRRDVKRSRREPTRVAKSGYVLIVVDTKETERNYFEGLKNATSSPSLIKIEKAKKTQTIVEFTVDYINKNGLPQAEVWLVFDRDDVEDFDGIISRANNKSFKVGWSNPCFEIWLHAYFGEMPTCNDSQDCIRRFSEAFKKRCGKEYKKNEKRIYKILEDNGSCDDAITIAKQKYLQAREHYGDSSPSLLSPACTVYQLVQELRKNIQK